MRVLIVAYYFPPDATIGAVRPYQFARLLPEHGIEPWVLTVQPEFAEQLDSKMAMDGVPTEHIIRTGVQPTRRRRWLKVATGLKAQLKRRLKSSDVTPANLSGVSDDETYVENTPHLRRWLTAWILFPDRMTGWYRPALRAANHRLGDIHFDAVLSTSPPLTSHFVGRAIANQRQIPWIMDLRDPWFLDIDEVNSRTLNDLYQRLFLRHCERANAIVLNTERLRQNLLAQMPSVAGKMVTIPNGVNLQNIKRAHAPSPPPKQFRIGHYGSVYARRSAETFLQGLRLWLDRSGVDANEVAVRFTGPEFGRTAEFVAQLKLEALVSFAPPVSRNQVMDLMREEYVLLLLANNHPLQIPGKLYEYLAAGRRILANTESDSAPALLIRNQRGGAIVDSAEAIAQALAHYWDAYKQGCSADVDYSQLLDECSYERRVDSLVKVIQQVTSPQIPSPLEV